MIAYSNYLAFIPLSNWLKGFDRYRQTFNKTSIPGAHFPDSFYVLGEDASEDERRSVLAKTGDLIKRLGVKGDRVIALRSRLPVSGSTPTLALPNEFTGTGVGWRWPSPELPLVGQGLVSEDGVISDCPHELITAAAFALPDRSLYTWQDCAPRTFSVLPISRACNASCAFCFSKASVSESVIPSHLDLASISRWSSLASSRGAQRAVITGGGEPTLLPHQAMRDLVSSLSQDYANILLISNGSLIAKMVERQGEGHALNVMSSWREAGLTRLAVSRHGIDDESDARLMGISVPGDRVLSLLSNAGIPSRLICVMQKGGVETESDVLHYLKRAAASGCDNVCFKELYVSSLSENPRAPSRENLYCQANQVPLSMLVDALTALGFGVVDRLPWGSPVYAGVVDGVKMSVAAYTEPSVGWERSSGVVRSWNWLADNTCLASLEDPSSILDLSVAGG